MLSFVLRPILGTMYELDNYCTSLHVLCWCQSPNHHESFSSCQLRLRDGLCKETIFSESIIESIIRLLFVPQGFAGGGTIVLLSLEGTKLPNACCALSSFTRPHLVFCFSMYVCRALFLTLLVMYPNFRDATSRFL